MTASLLRANSAFPCLGASQGSSVRTMANHLFAISRERRERCNQSWPRNPESSASS